MSLAAPSLWVEHSIERLLRALSREAANHAVDRAAEAITAALALIRFQRSFVSGGPFRNEPFGPTPRMPAEPLWPAHAEAFAALAARSDRAEIADLVCCLEKLQRQLLFEADCAESTDALNNSRQYLQAAGYLDQAAAELASLV